MGRFLTLSLMVLLCCAWLSGCFAPEPIVTMSVEPTSGYGPLLVHMEAQSLDAASNPLSYEWEFSDGSSATGPIIDHEFTGKGKITVRLVVTDEQGRQTVVDAAVRLLNRIPHAQFTYQPNPAPTHHPVRFDASDSNDPDGEIVSYHWDFGDGSTAVGLIAEHEFQTPGIEYRVVLAVMDDDGDENHMYRDIELIGCDH